MKKIYISGKITDKTTGLPMLGAKQKFQDTEDLLIAQGWEVINPMKNGLPTEAIWEHHIARDLVLLSGCDVIYVLPCHVNSTGARIEICFAIEKGITVLHHSG